jgi:hypothetical protein
MRIPASTEEMDGSAFVCYPFEDIRVEEDSQHFAIKGRFLVRSDGTEIVRYFGFGGEIFMSMTVEELGKSCFESHNHLRRIVFESGSKLRLIGEYGLAGCLSIIDEHCDSCLSGNDRTISIRMLC